MTAISPLPKIVREHYRVFPGTRATLCCVEFDNGKSAIGVSESLRPEEQARAEAKADALANMNILLAPRMVTQQTAERFSPEEIARVAHEVNRAFCQALGDDSQLPWAEAPEWQRQSALEGVTFLMTNSWMEREHPCLVPFSDLPIEQRAKDFIFCVVVRVLTSQPA